MRPVVSNSARPGTTSLISAGNNTATADAARSGGSCALAGRVTTLSALLDSVAGRGVSEHDRADVFVGAGCDCTAQTGIKPVHAAALNQPGRPSTANRAIRIVRRSAGFRDYPPLLRNRSVTGTRRRRRRTEEHGGRDQRRAMPATSELDQVWHRADDSVDYTTAIGNDESDRVMLLSSRLGAPRSSNRLTRWARASSIAWISILASPCPGHTCMP